MEDDDGIRAAVEQGFLVKMEAEAEQNWRTARDDRGEPMRPWLSPSDASHGMYRRAEAHLRNQPIPPEARRSAIDGLMGVEGIVLSDNERDVAERLFHGDPDAVSRYARAKADNDRPALSDADASRIQRRILTGLYGNRVGMESGMFRMNDPAAESEAKVGALAGMIARARSQLDEDGTWRPAPRPGAPVDDAAAKRVKFQHAFDNAKRELARKR